MRLPDGSAPTVHGRYVEEAIGSGVTVIPLRAAAGSPASAYPIEATLLEPARGVTISRTSVPLTLGP